MFLPMRAPSILPRQANADLLEVGVPHKGQLRTPFLGPLRPQPRQRERRHTVRLHTPHRHLQGLRGLHSTLRKLSVASEFPHCNGGRSGAFLSRERLECSHKSRGASTGASGCEDAGPWVSGGCCLLRESASESVCVSVCVFVCVCEREDLLASFQFPSLVYNNMHR